MEEVKQIKRKILKARFPDSLIIHIMGNLFCIFEIPYSQKCSTSENLFLAFGIFCGLK